jgi:hypothetical protein
LTRAAPDRLSAGFAAAPPLRAGEAREKRRPADLQIRVIYRCLQAPEPFGVTHPGRKRHVGGGRLRCTPCPAFTPSAPSSDSGDLQVSAGARGCSRPIPAAIAASAAAGFGAPPRPAFSPSAPPAESGDLQASAGSRGCRPAPAWAGTAPARGSAQTPAPAPRPRAPRRFGASGCVNSRSAIPATIFPAASHGINTGSILRFLAYSTR